jgi:hypothetical protein
VTESVQNGRRFKIFRGEEPVSFGEYLDLLAEDPKFDSWYTSVLAGADYDAFFWEHPPLCNSVTDSAAEFVLIESPSLARIGPNPEPFSSHFKREPEGEIVSFCSLGGDAVLLAPRPSGRLETCAHLAAFVRQAPEYRVQSLWRATGRAMRQHLGERKLWLSTSGLGVSWLHVRLDSYPKYYQYQPYAIVA